MPTLVEIQATALEAITQFVEALRRKDVHLERGFTHFPALMNEPLVQEAVNEVLDAMTAEVQAGMAEGNGGATRQVEPPEPGRWIVYAQDEIGTCDVTVVVASGAEEAVRTAQDAAIPVAQRKVRGKGLSFRAIPLREMPEVEI